MVRSGKQNGMVSILRQTEGAANASVNSATFTWVTWKAHIFCNITPRRGKEVEVQGQIASETYMKFDFEYYEVEGILETDAVLLNGQIYDIKAILADEALKEFTSVDAVLRRVPTGRL